MRGGRRAYDGRVARRRPLRSRLLVPFAGLALAGALLAGCAPAPGAAATVDGQVIGEDAVASVIDQLNPYLSTPMTPSVAVVELATAPEYVEVAADAGLGVSADQAVETLTGLAAQAGIETSDFSDATVLVTRSILSRSAIAGESDASELLADVSERVAGLDVTLSPRYGTWDGTTGAVLAPTYSWIVQPAADAA